MAVLQPTLGGPGGFQVGPTVPGPQPGAVGPAQQPGQFVPPTGLIGAEQALQGGLAGALAGLQQGQQGIFSSFGQGRGDIFGQSGQGRGDIFGQSGQGVAGLNPFVSPGQQAQQRQGALSGAFGPEAQAAAFQSFMDSPGQAHLRERGELAVTRNAAALGGLGGGRVQQELQRQGIGLAAQDFQNQFNRLGDVTGQGLQAAGQIGALRGQAAGQLGSLAGQTAGQLGALSGQRGTLLGNLGGQAGQFAFDTGQSLAGGRTQAGRDIAGQIGGTTTALSNLVNQQGQGLSDLLGTSGGDLSTILQNAGNLSAQDQQALQALLSNIGLTQGGQIAGQPALPGVTPVEGVIGKIASGVGTVIASDRRLKMNITAVGMTPGGNTLYTWDWNAEGRRIGGGPTFGVIAQEVPDATVVGAHGYLMVDYSKVQ